jgi:hypothetical protein
MTATKSAEHSNLLLREGVPLLPIVVDLNPQRYADDLVRAKN